MKARTGLIVRRRVEYRIIDRNDQIRPAGKFDSPGYGETLQEWNEETQRWVDVDRTPYLGHNRISRGKDEVY